MTHVTYYLPALRRAVNLTEENGDAVCLLNHPFIGNNLGPVELIALAKQMEVKYRFCAFYGFINSANTERANSGWPLAYHLHLIKAVVDAVKVDEHSY